MGTQIFKIEGELSEIIYPKLVTPKTKKSENMSIWANPEATLHLPTI